jgi:hypothetical protein
MRIRRGVLVAALLACWLMPVAGASTGNGAIAYTALYFAVYSNERYLDGDPSTNSVAGPLSWSPDGTKLLYWRSQGGAAVVNADGTNPHAVVFGAPYNVVWNPLCWVGTDIVVLKKITFLEDTTAGSKVADFYIAHSDGTALQPLTTDGLQVGATGACVPATGTFFFTRSGGANFRVAAGGGAPVRLPLTGGTIQPAPNGQMLAWLTDAGLFLVDDTRSLTLWKLADSAAGSALVWSPDSGQLAFSQQGVAVANVRTGSVRELGYGDPMQWSPDGTKMLVRCGMRAVCMINADGTCPRLVLSGFGSENAAWQPVPGGVPSAPIRCSDLSMHEEVAPGTVFPEEVAVFTFTVENEGNEPAPKVGLQIKTVRNGEPVSLSADPGNCDVDAKLCEFGTIDPGASVKMTVAVRAPAAVNDGALSLLMRNLGPATTVPDFLASAVVATCDFTGTDGRDNLRGTYRDETICGLRGPDRLYGKGGGDVLVGGLGIDLFYGGAGDDRILARDGQRDTINCGPGYDTVIADTIDHVAKSCEKVQRNRR